MISDSEIQTDTVWYTLLYNRKLITCEASTLPTYTLVVHTYVYTHKSAIRESCIHTRELDDQDQGARRSLEVMT